MKKKRVLTEMTADEILVKAGLDLNQDSAKLNKISEEILTRFGSNKDVFRKGRISLYLNDIHSHNKEANEISVTHNGNITICETWEDAFGETGFTFQDNPYYLFQLQ